MQDGVVKSKGIRDGTLFLFSSVYIAHERLPRQNKEDRLRSVSQ